MKKTTQAYGVIYARYSSHNQKDVSIEQQVEACQKFAKNENIKILEIYADRAMSGRSDQRPNFQRMLKDAESGEFQYVISWKSNRIGRNMLQAMQNASYLNTLGVRCLYTEEDFDDSAAGRFALRSMMNVNQFYSENMAEDVKRGMMDNASKCLSNGQQIYGYASDKDKKIYINQEQAVIVREIFERVANRETFTDIANDLNNRGIKASRGNPWNNKGFRRFLSNEKYRGIYMFDDIRVEDGVPRIIEDDLFYRVQEVMNEHTPHSGRHTNNSPYLLTGKLFCGKCKSPMVGMSGYGKLKEFYQYYRCSGKKKLGCDKKNISKQLIEDLVADILVNEVLTDDTINWIAMKAEEYQEKVEQSSELGVLEAEIKSVNNSINNLIKAMEQGIITASTKERLMQLEKEKEDLLRKISAARAKIVKIDKKEVISTLTAYKTGDINDIDFRRALFNLFIDAVYVYDDKLALMFTFNNSDSLDIEGKDLKDKLDKLSESSFSVANGLPIITQANPMFVKGVFIIKKSLQ